MRVKALKVIRSSHLSNDVVRPGDVGEVTNTNTDLTGRKLFKVRWMSGMEGVVLPTDIEFIEPVTELSPAATESVSTLGEAASSSLGTMHPALHAGRPGQEPVGNLPHFHQHEWLGSRAWFSEFHDLGGD